VAGALSLAKVAGARLPMALSGLKVEWVRRLKELERENVLLERAVGGQADPERGCQGKLLSASPAP